VRLEAYKGVRVHILAFWTVTPCTLVIAHVCEKLVDFIFYPEFEVSTFLRNAGNCLQDYGVKTQKVNT
jgi:hypothetical protein